MDAIEAAKQLVFLFARDDEEDACVAGNDYDGQHMGARISAVFVVLIASSFGSFFPILSSRYSFIRLPQVCFFVAKYFGSGVIIATAFIHLLQPANENLSTECLGAPFTEYPLAFAFCLIMIFVMLFMELSAYHWVEVRSEHMGLEAGAEVHTHSHFGDENMFVKSNKEESKALAEEDTGDITPKADESDPESDSKGEFIAKDRYIGNLINVFILEFGIIFHSVFIGLTLSCSGDEFITLYIVVVFHQLFEGLGLGTRIALVDWPKTKRLTPWLLALAYGLTTPISIAIGLGVRTSYPANSRRALITNGVFDSISAGILVYTGMVELMAHEFIFTDEFKGKHSYRKMMSALVTMAVGAGVMALLGKWA